ncbi:unnamed protein product, partial [Lymnaea stagnalis]
MNGYGSNQAYGQHNGEGGHSGKGHRQTQHRPFAGHGQSEIPKLHVQPDTPVPPSSQSTPGPGDRGGGYLSHLPAISPRSLTTTAKPAQGKTSLSTRNSFEQKSGASTGRVAGSNPISRIIPVATTSSFPNKHMKQEIKTDEYGPKCIPLVIRQTNALSNTSQPANTASNFGSSCNNGKPFAISSNVNKNSMASLETFSEFPSISGDISVGDRQHSLQPLQKHFNHAPAGSDVSSIGGQHSLHTSRNGTHLTSISSSSSHQDRMSAAPGMVQVSGQTPRNSIGTPKPGDPTGNHVFREPALPKQSDWLHYKPLPSAASSTMGSSDNDSTSIVVPGSSTSHYNQGSNLSPFQGNDVSPFPSSFTSPRHSASTYARASQKRALSISPSLSDGLDLNHIRLSPNSLGPYLASRTSSTSGSPQLGQLGSFSHLSARNSSPYSQTGSGQRRFGGNHTPYSMASGVKSENNIDYFGMEPSEASGFEEIMRNAFVARQNEMPYIEQNIALGRFPNGVNGFYNGQIEHQNVGSNQG